ncbi:MAG: hypothetical protein WC919_08055 [Candidatus Paceibacterota bacterium]|jgi:hypothetical protein
MKDITVLDLVWFILKVIVALAIIGLLPFAFGGVVFVLSKVNGTLLSILSTVFVLIVIMLASDKKS